MATPSLITYLSSVGHILERLQVKKGSKISDIVAQIIETFKICYNSTRGMKMGVQVKFKAKMEFKTFLFFLHLYGN